MPIIDDTQINIAYPVGEKSLTPPEQPSVLGEFWEQPAQKTWGESFGAGFSLDAMLVSPFLDKVSRVDTKPDPNFNLTDTMKEYGIPIDDIKYYGFANNAEHFNAIYTQRQDEAERRRTAEANGFAGVLGSIAGGILSPTIFIPGSGMVRAIQGGYSVGRSALAVAGLAGVSTAIDESVLQATQQLRTADEGAFNIGGSLLIGGLIGAGAAKFLTKSEQLAFERAWTRVNEQMGPNGLSSDARTQFSRDDLSLDGIAANWAAKPFTELNPLLRAITSPVAEVRQAMANLGEYTLYRRMNNEGIAAVPGGAAETQAMRFMKDTMLLGYKGDNEAYAAMRKAGVNMTYDDFQVAVGKALNRGDIGENDFVTQAAQSWRRNVLDPYKDWGVRLGVFPKDVSPENALSYFHYVYNKEKMLAEEFEPTGFKARLRPEMERRITKAFEDHRTKLEEKLAGVDEAVRLLKMTGDERVIKLQEIDEQLGLLVGNQRQGFDAAEEISRLRSELREAKRAGNTQSVDRLKQEIKLLQPVAEPYQKPANALKRSRRVLEQGYAAQDAKVAQIQDQLINIEETNLTTLQRIVSMGQKLQRDLDKVGTQDDLDEVISNFKNLFADTAARYDANAEKIAQQLAKISEKADVSPEATKAFDTAPLRARLEKLMNAQRNQSAKLTRLAEKIEAAEALDIIEIKAEIKAAVDDILAQRNSTVLARGERAQRLLDRKDALDPEKVAGEIERLERMRKRLDDAFEERWGTKNLVKGDIRNGTPDFTAAVDSALSRLFDKIVGRDGLDDDGIEWRIALKSGPLKERTLNFDHDLLEPDLDMNARRVMELFSRRITGQLAMAQKFDGDVTLEQTISQVTEAYKRLADQVSQAKTYEEAKALLGDSFGITGETKNLLAGQGRSTQTLLKWIDSQRKADIHDLKAMRDLVLGRYKINEHQSAYGRLVRSANMFSYITRSGRFLISSLTDLYRAPMVHGLTNTFGTMVKTYGKNLVTASGEKVSEALAREANRAGLIADRWFNHKMMSVMNVGDPFVTGTPVERLLHNGTKMATWFNGMAWFQDLAETMNSTLSIRKIANSIVRGTNERELAMLGIDRRSGLWDAIKEQLEKHGELIDDMWVPNTESWDNQAAVDAFRNALSVDVSRTAVKPGLGDAPLVAKGVTGSALLQFRSFMLASNQRILLAGLQENPRRFMSGIVGMVGIGGLVSYLKAMGRGDDSFEKWKRQAENPGFIIGEALDGSGIFSMAFEVANSIEKAGKTAGVSFNPIKSPLVMATGGGYSVDSQQTYGQDLFRAMVGPSFGLFTDIPRAMGSTADIIQGDASKADVRAVQNITPFFATHIGFSDLVKILNDDHPWVKR